MKLHHLILPMLLLLLLVGCVPVTPVILPTETLAPTEPVIPTVITPGSEVSAGKFIFIDHHLQKEGQCVKGTCNPGPMIDFPTYSWDDANKILSAMLLNFEINDQLKAVYGNGQSLSGIAGGGAGTRLDGVYNLPYQQNDLTLTRIDADGTAYLQYQGQSVVLETGEEWRMVTEEDIHQDQGTAHIVTTDRIVNYGVLEPSQIIKR